MTNPTPLSPAAHAMALAFNDRYELCGPLEDNWHEACMAAALRVLANQMFPYEKEAPKADFDCEPTPRYNFKSGKCDGPLGYDHGAYLRRSWAQEELNKKWKIRQESRAQILAIAAELAGDPDPTTTETTDDD